MTKLALRIASVTLVAGGLIVACSAPSDGTGARASVAGGGFDEDVDPGGLADYMGKADGDPCAMHPGGALTGEDLLVVVNKEEARQLRADWSPPDLVPLDEREMMPGRTGALRIAALRAFEDLAAAAQSEAGLDLGIRSAYRSFETQCYTFNYKVEIHGYEHASTYSALPGRSEHQLGTTMDITSERLGWELEQSMGESDEGMWLVSNAYRFGFGLSYPKGYEALSGYSYEPWHWRYIGRAAAAEMAASGLTLIEYLLACDQGDPRFECPREPPPELKPNEGFIGGACASEQDCETLDSTRMCLLDGYPGGQCTIPCTLYCPDRVGANATTFCVATQDDPTVGTCHSKCDEALFPETGCREGYVCTEASRPNEAGTGFVCLPEPR